MTWRSIVLAVLLASLVGLLVTWPSGAQEATPASPPAGTPIPFSGETFVGQTSDPDTFVAIVIAEPAGNGDERQAQAYLCNATTIDAWLTGTLAGDRLDLRAGDGTRLEATRGEQWVEGTATLADGTTLGVLTKPAVGTTGLYTVTIDAAGRVQGSSTMAGELVGRVEAGGDGLAGSRFRLVMMVTSPEGDTAEIEAGAAVAGEGNVRLIVLGDGHVRGRGTTRDGREPIDLISNP